MPRSKTTRRNARTVQQVEAVTLTESAIQKHIDEKSLARGKEYHRDRAIFGACRDGDRLTARCRGSYSNLYRVEATIQDGRIINADCSCPVGEGGHCKHVAALLLSWKAAAEPFMEVGNVREMLREQSKADLLDLIGFLIDREPELELLIAHMTSGKATDVEPYRQMAVAAFEGTGSESPSRIGPEAALAAVRAIGDRFAVRGDARSSSIVYRGLLEGVMALGTDHPDLAYESTGDLIEVLSGSAVCVATCLKSLPHEHPERTSLAETLAEWLEFDLRLSGIGLADGVITAYARHSTKEERVELAQRLEELTDDFDDGDWADERVAEWLLELEDADFDDEEYLKRCRRLGRTEPLVERLLSLDRIDEAVAAAGRLYGLTLLPVADKLVELGRSTDAARLVRARIEKNDAGVWPLRDWLERFAEKAGDWATVTELTWDAYREFPSAGGYRSLREAAERARRWKGLRPKAIRIAERSGRLELYLRILLDDGEVDLATARLRNAPSKSLDPDVRRDVALAAATNDPESGMALLWENVELLILRRNRNAYRSACDDLVLLRELYRKLDRMAEWQQALTSLLEDNPRLRALHTELKQTGL